MDSTYSSLFLLEVSSSNDKQYSNSSLIVLNDSSAGDEDNDSTLIRFSQSSHNYSTDISLELDQGYSQNSDSIPFHSTPLKRSRECHQLCDPLTSSDSDSESLTFETPPSQLTKEVSEITTSQCCKKRCLAGLSILELEKAREVFKKKKWIEQQQFLLNSAFICHPVTSDTTTCSYNATTDVSTMMIEGKRVCRQAFTKALGISRKRYRRMVNLHQKGVTKATKKTPTRSQYSRTTEARTWMDTYFHLVGDQMPHVQRIHLPQFLTKKDIYLRMKRELMDHGIDEKNIIKMSTFYRIWKEAFRDVIIPQQSRFSKCDVCTKFDQERIQTGGRCGFIEEYTKHLKIVEQERKKYYKHREKARSNPEKCLTIIIDGMDQSKTNLPQFVQIPKAVQGLHQLRTHITGVIVHTRSPHGKLAYAFIDMLQYPHDSNLNIHVLLDVLLVNKDKLPPDLNIQLDNTSRENKNKYILGFCALLVAKKVFRKIRINFLPVGHTHEDIDQLFLRVSKQLKQKGAETLQHLVEQVSVSSTPAPLVKVVDSVLDVKSWITPTLEDVHGHSTPHCFKFVLVDESEVFMYYRLWSSDAWCETADALKLLHGLPSGLPEVVAPTDVKIDLQRLKQDTPKYRPWLSPEAVDWWASFDLESVYQKSQQAPTAWPLLELMDERDLVDTSLPQLPPPSDELRALFSAETAPCTVYTGNYRPQSKTTVVSVQDLSTLTVGHLVAVFTEEVLSEPWVARVDRVTDQDVDVIWLEGEYGKSWRVAKTQDPTNRRKKVDWRDTIQKNSIVLFDFQLTSTGHLRKKTVEHLKEVYGQLRANNV